MSRRQAESAESLQALTDAAYDRWAPVYDLIFNLPFRPGREAAAAAAAEATPPQGELLVVGVGTGLELELLPRTARVTGIDVSQPMLDVARRRVARRGLANVRKLITMDAGAMTFEDARFHTVLAPFVLTVVPEPRRMLDQIWRVLRPGGEMILVNHFSAEGGVRGGVERWLDGHSDWLGWRAVFAYEILSGWVDAKPDAEPRERRTIAPFGLFTLTRVGKRP